MLKKLLILPILGSILSLGAFASASDLTISCSNSSCSPVNSISVSDGLDNFIDNYVLNYSCSVSDNADPGTVSISLVVSYLAPDNSTIPSYYTLLCDSSSVDLRSSFGDFPITSVSIQPPFQTPFDLTFIDISPSTPDTPDDSDSSLGIPEIPASFTSGLTSLVNNFGGTIANWLPTIILVALGIYAIFALFRVVRNYARSSFRG